MRAVVRERFGGPEALSLRELETPEPAADEVLVRVRAASVNRADLYALTGRPYIARPVEGLRAPKSERIGVDYAGVVEGVGTDVTTFRPGDEVFGGRDGAFAEYVCVREERAIVHKPGNVTFEQAAAVGIAGLTALQGLRDKGRVESGQRVLVNGASGGVGTFAVQVAKALGGNVTGVCSLRNVELVRSLGADDVVDYAAEDFTRSGRRYDVIFDVAGNRPWSHLRRVLEPNGTIVLVGGPMTNAWLGPLAHVAAVKLATLRGSRKSVFFVAKFNKADLELLRGLLETGKLTPVVDREFSLGEIAHAFRYMAEGHPRAKVVVTP